MNTESKHNWEMEVENFIRYMDKEDFKYLLRIQHRKGYPSDVLDIFERSLEEGYLNMGKKLRLQTESDQNIILDFIMYCAVNELEIIRAKKEKPIESIRFISESEHIKEIEREQIKERERIKRFENTGCLYRKIVKKQKLTIL